MQNIEVLKAIYRDRFTRFWSSTASWVNVMDLLTIYGFA